MPGVTRPAGPTATGCYPRRARSAYERGRALHWPQTSTGALRAVRGALVGTHDFTAFTPTETEHVRFARDVFGRRAGARAEPGCSSSGSRPTRSCAA